MSARVLLCDLGGVLFDFDHPHRLRILARACGSSPERIHALLWESDFGAGSDEGRYPTAADVRARVRAVIGFPGTDDELDAAWCAAYRPNPAVINVLISGHGLPMAVFTNNGPLEEDALPRLHSQAFAPFDRLFFSHRLGHRKPHLAAFAAVTTGLGVAPGDILFVDDSGANVAAARRHGWRAVRFRTPGTLADTVREYAAPGPDVQPSLDRGLGDRNGRETGMPSSPVGA